MTTAARLARTKPTRRVSTSTPDHDEEDAPIHDKDIHGAEMIEGQLQEIKIKTLQPIDRLDKL
jgi:hypothetical protein